MKKREANIAIIDYGFGNLHSLVKALAYLGASSTIIHTPEKITQADAIFLPGVGAFGEGMRELAQRGFIEPIKAHASLSKPLFGICLGMQFLFESSEEFGQHAGLGLLRGGVHKLVPSQKQCKIPHIGWNELHYASHKKNWDKTVLENITEREQVYFVHSYAPVPLEKSDIIASADYGGAVFAAVVEKSGIVGTQFHPEKSGLVGLGILKNFLNRV